MEKTNLNKIYLKVLEAFLNKLILIMIVDLKILQNFFKC